MAEDQKLIIKKFVPEEHMTSSDEKIRFKSLSGDTRKQQYTEVAEEEPQAAAPVAETKKQPFLKRLWRGFSALVEQTAREFKQDRPPVLEAQYRNQILIILLCVLLLNAFGIVMITSAGYYYADTYLGDSYSLTIGQLKGIGVGLVLGIIAFIFPLFIIEKKWFVWAAYIGTCGLSLAVFFMGVISGGSKRWLNLFGITFQPAELVKLGMILLLSYYCFHPDKKLNNFWGHIFRYVIIGIPTLLVFIENATSGIIILLIGMAILYVSGYRIWPLLVMMVAGVFALYKATQLYLDAKLPEFLMKLFDAYYYRIERIIAWLDPFLVGDDGGYQTVQSLYAIGSGGLFGRGLGNSLQKLGFVPEAHNDFIFAVICEEWGILGPIFLVFFYGLFAYEGFRFCGQLKKRMSRFVIFGVTFQVVLQTLLHMFINLGLLPSTGVSLPFVSYGGTSVSILLASIGLMLNAARYTTAPAAKTTKKVSRVKA